MLEATSAKQFTTQGHVRNIVHRMTASVRVEQAGNIQVGRDVGLHILYRCDILETSNRPLQNPKARVPSTSSAQVVEQEKQLKL